MIVTTTPQLTEADKAELAKFLETILAHEQLLVDHSSPRVRCSGKLNVYFDGVMRKINITQYNSWTLNDTVYVGTSEGGVSYSDRLSILLALMQYVDQSEALVTAASKAITRYLLSELNMMRSNMVVSSVPATGIAFSESQSAALVDGVWQLPSGEEVDVTGEGWTVCASQLPPVREADPSTPPWARVTETPVREVALTTIEPTAPIFTIDQRIHYTSIIGLNMLPGDGTVSGGPNDRGNYIVTLDSGEGDLWVHPSAMTALEETPVVDADIQF